MKTELNGINWELVNWTNNHENSLSDFSSQSHEKDFGSFNIEDLQVDINYSEQKMIKVKSAIDVLYDKKQRKNYTPVEIKSAESVFFNYFQIHSHEYFHLYQTLFLPVPALLRQVRFNKLRYDSYVFFLALEQGKTFKLKEFEELTDVLKNDYLTLSSDFKIDYQKSLANYKFYESKWLHEVNGISYHHIFEGMAHIASMQLSDNPEVDKLGVEENEYYKAFNYFVSSIDSSFNVDIRIKYLLFLYFCYFSSHIIEDFNDDKSKSKPVEMFIYLCSTVNFFINGIEKYKKVYSKPDKVTLLLSDKWGIKDLLKNSNAKTISSIYAFYEIIDTIEERADRFITPRKYKTKYDNELLEKAKLFDLKIKDKYQLAKLVIFPIKFSNIYSFYTSFRDEISKNQSFTYQQEAEFYSFVRSIKNIFRARRKQAAPLWCCDEHGFIFDELAFLRCENPESAAEKIRVMSKRETYEVFLI